MNIAPECGSIVAFRDAWPRTKEQRSEELDPGGADWVQFYRRRERAERAAAKSAGCGAARCVHQELAQAYALLIQRGPLR